MKNLEFKVRCSATALSDLAERAHSLGVSAQEVLWQRDTYFHAPIGRLKLREMRRIDQSADGSGPGSETDASVLISYVRLDGLHSRASTYHLVPTDTPDLLRVALKQALGVQGIIEKERILFVYEHTRIHLDQVVGQGSFAELETVFPTDLADEAALTREHQLVKDVLALRRFEAVSTSYIDLLP